MSHDSYEVPFIPGETRAERKRYQRQFMQPPAVIAKPKRGPNRKMRRNKKGPFGEDL